MKYTKRICLALLLPHIAVMILLTPPAVALLIYSMVVLGTESPISYAAYVLSAYMLTVWCVRIPRLIAFFKRVKRENRYVRRWREDMRLRVKLSLYGSFLWNTSYAALQLGLGLYHDSLWYDSLAAYYLCLAIMRLCLMHHTRRHAPREQMRKEWMQYRACGWVFLIMNVALAAMVFLMVYQNRTFEHHQITAIAMAAYTFTTFTFAVINLVRYRRVGSPVYSASKAISMASACVSMITLTSTMLTSFGDAVQDSMMRTAMLGSLGGAVSVFIIVMAVYMIVQSTEKMKIWETGMPHGE